jgi:hypothetical protein
MAEAKPLWLQYYEMSPQEAEAQRARELAAMQSGEMSEDEAMERAAAWRKAQAQPQAREREAASLEKLGRLARASGCPRGTPVIPWLIEHGLLESNGDGGYRLTARAKLQQIKP